MKTNWVMLILAHLCFTMRLPVQAQWIEWPVSAGGNGHSYLPVVVESYIDWDHASNEARKAGGYLATLTSAAENDFVFGLINSPQYWYLGELGPLLGGYQPAGSAEPAGGWTWVSGEPWNYSNWAGPQPDNGGQEDGLHFWIGNHWNDISTNNVTFVSYIVERELCTPHKAAAVAQHVNGFVVGATITDSGCGYTNPPVILIKGGGGTGAVARVVMDGDKVGAIQITDAGCCYTNTPKIVIGSPPFVPWVSIGVSKVNVTQNVVLGWKYVLESSTNNLNWTATGPAFVADSEMIVDEFDVSETGRFFRLRVVP